MSIADVWPDHLLTLDEWDALELPEHLSRRVELVEGVLVVSPAPRLRHQGAVVRLAAQLDSLGDRRALAGPDVVLEGDPTPTVRQPDVAVVPAEIVDDRPRCDACDVVAVFEVLSLGTTRVDRVLKMHEYAQAGISLYGIVDLGPAATLAEFRLVGGHYEQVTEHRGTAPLAVGVVDLDAL